MKHSIAMIVALGACLALPALAQPMTAPAKTDMMVDEGMKMMDADANGMISMAEHSAATKTMFTTSDSNADGMLSADEMTAAATIKMTAMNMPMDVDKTKMMVQSKIRMLDTDKDGMVSWTEEEVADGAMFKKADANADGMISKPEMTTAMSHMKKK